MKTFFALIALAAVLLGSAIAAPADEAEPKKCANFCTMEFNPVCGYDGNCYQSYPNPCAYDSEKCNRKSNLETVDMSLCNLATQNNHPNYKIC